LPLLEELAVLGDAQTTLLLLRQCASYCRMVYSTRVTPPRAWRQHCNPSTRQSTAA
jgi:hypothetical protein